MISKLFTVSKNYLNFMAKKLESQSFIITHKGTTYFSLKATRNMVKSFVTNYPLIVFEEKILAVVWNIKMYAEKKWTTNYMCN